MRTISPSEIPELFARSDTGNILEHFIYNAIIALKFSKFAVKNFDTSGLPDREGWGFVSGLLHSKYPHLIDLLFDKGLIYPGGTGYTAWADSILF